MKRSRQDGTGSTRTFTVVTVDKAMGSCSEIRKDIGRSYIFLYMLAAKMPNIQFMRLGSGETAAETRLQSDRIFES